jgi:hypothetical protein
LVNIASSVVEDAEHRDQTVGGAVRATNVGARSADVVDRETDTTSVLGDLSAHLTRESGDEDGRNDENQPPTEKKTTFRVS